MAPKKATVSKKGKAVMQASEPAAMQQDGNLKPALVGSRISTEAQLDKVRLMAASASNEHGATVLKPANNPYGSLYPIFMHTLLAGLVPPFSDFFLAVLERYQIQVLPGKRAGTGHKDRYEERTTVFEKGARVDTVPRERASPAKTFAEEAEATFEVTGGTPSTSVYK